MQELPHADVAPTYARMQKTSLGPSLLTPPFAEGLSPGPFATFRTIRPLGHTWPIGNVCFYWTIYLMIERSNVVLCVTNLHGWYGTSIWYVSTFMYLNCFIAKWVCSHFTMNTANLTQVFYREDIAPHWKVPSFCKLISQGKESKLFWNENVNFMKDVASLVHTYSRLRMKLKHQWSKYSTGKYTQFILLVKMTCWAMNWWN